MIKIVFDYPSEPNRAPGGWILGFALAAVLLAAALPHSNLHAAATCNSGQLNAPHLRHRLQLQAPAAQPDANAGQGRHRCWRDHAIKRPSMKSTSSSP